MSDSAANPCACDAALQLERLRANVERHAAARAARLVNEEAARQSTPVRVALREVARRLALIARGDA